MFGERWTACQSAFLSFKSFQGPGGHAEVEIDRRFPFDNSQLFKLENWPEVFAHKCWLSSNRYYSVG